MPAMSPTEAAFCRSAPWRAFTRRVVLPWALQGITPAGDVLEIGAGSGTMAAEVLRAHPDVRMTATDYDDAMVVAAERRLAPFGDRAVARAADATALPFDDASFDFVLSFIMLHHTVQWETAIAEVARVLRRGGSFVGYDLVRRALPARHHPPGAAHRMMRVDELRARLDSLPFTEVKIRSGLAGRVVRFRATRA